MAEANTSTIAVNVYGSVVIEASIATIAVYVYGSLAKEVIIVTVVVDVSSRVARGERFVAAKIVCGCGCVAISTMFPTIKDAVYSVHSAWANKLPVLSRRIVVGSLRAVARSSIESYRNTTLRVESGDMTDAGLQRLTMMVCHDNSSHQLPQIQR